MKLNERLPNTFVFNGQKYPINLAFDRVLDVQEIQQEPLISVDEKINLMIEALDIECDDIKKPEIIEYVLYNVINQADSELDIEYDLLGNPMKRTAEVNVKTLDFEQDSSLIYSAFRQTYGINLYEEFGRMHWYEFVSLLEGLPEDTLLYQVRSIRQWEPQKGDSKEYKRKMRKLKEQYKLTPRKEE